VKVGLCRARGSALPSADPIRVESLYSPFSSGWCVVSGCHPPGPGRKRPGWQTVFMCALQATSAGVAVVLSFVALPQRSVVLILLPLLEPMVTRHKRDNIIKVGDSGGRECVDNIL